MDEELDALHPARWPAVVEISTPSGQAYRERMDFPRGDPENPVTAEELVTKFHALAAGPWGEQRSRVLAQAVLDLENVVDVADLFQVLSPNHYGRVWHSSCGITQHER